MHRNQDEWIEAYKSIGALWIHDENPKRPHALLSSGLHSSGFFNSRLVIEDSKLLWDAAEDLIEKLLYNYPGHTYIDVVVGPQTGATKLAGFMSLALGQKSRRHCHYASPQKTGVDGKGPMAFSYDERVLLRDKKVLLCDDVVTTLDSLERARTAVRSNGGQASPSVAVLVNRSRHSTFGEGAIVSLIEKHLPTWTPEDCPLCKVGSKEIRPKDNWAMLNAEY